MKKFLVFLLLACVCLSLFACVPNNKAEEGEQEEAAVPASGVTINVYNWGQYMSLGEEDYIDVNAAFEEATGIHVNYIEYDSNETLYSKLEMGGSSYDIIIPSDYMVERLIENDMLEKINFDNIPNIENIPDQYRGMAFDPTGEYSVPYTVGGVGVIYNTKYVDEEDIGSWDLLWNEKYKGKILMFNNPRDAFAIAQAKNGLSLNSMSEEEFDIAYQSLVEQHNLVEKYVMDEIFAMMENEEAYVAPYYVGDFLTMKMENDDLDFYYPEETFNYFCDAICIPKGCQHKAEAEAYINFLCDPEIAGSNMDWVGYKTPVIGATDYMDEEFAALVLEYADDEVISQGEIFRNQTDDAIRYMNKKWSDLKASNLNQPLIYTFFGLEFVGIIVLIIVVGNRKKQKAKLYSEDK